MFISQIINYIFDKIVLSKFKYEIIQYDYELPQLLKQHYVITANFYGINCLLVFTKIKNTFISILIDRRTLSFSFEKININCIKYFQIHVNLDDSIFKGTIFDGIFNKTKNLFIITDVYQFKGQSMVESQLNYKLLSVINYLQSNYDSNDIENNINLTVNVTYELSEIEKIVNKIIPKITDNSVHGICFYPQISGTKLIFLFNNTDISMSTQSPICNKKKEIDKFIPKHNIDYIFELKKTNDPDVYFLNLVKSENKILKRVFIDIGYIPTIEKSIWCKKMLNNKNSILVKCKYHKNKNKYEPIKKVNAKHPTIITIKKQKITKKLKN